MKGRGEKKQRRKTKREKTKQINKQKKTEPKK
jgi:hypothetical protein